jgi:hypothetical protein
MSLFTHLAIAAVAAVVLSWLRGGFRDEPSVLFFFGLFGFLASLAVSIALRPASQDRIDARLGRSPRAHRLRYSAAAIAVVAAFWLTAPMVSRAGFAGWFVLVLLAITLPLVVSLLAPGWPLGWALAIATALTASLWRHNLRRPWGEVSDPLSVVPEYFGMWMMAVVVAGLVAFPRYRHLRSSSSASRAPAAAGGRVDSQI